MATTPSRYCDLEDLFTVGIHPNLVTTRLSKTQVEKAILDASSFMDSKLGQRYVLPLISVDRSLVRHCAAIAAWYLVPSIGVNPEGNGDTTIRDNYKDAVNWLEEVVQRRATPQVIDSSAAPTPGQSEMGGPRVRTSSGRGLTMRQARQGRGYFTGD